MAVRYFKNFPVVQYGEHSVRNIILKARLAKTLIDSYDNFYPYTIRNDEKATHVAHNYYGSIDYVWAIYAANDIIDPYFDWPLPEDDFQKMLIKKYGSLEYSLNAANYEYLRNRKRSYWMTKTTYENISDDERTGWTPVSIYDYERYLNEEKRKIRLLDNAIVADVSFQLEKQLKKVNKPR
jgi:hypothetical protein